MTFSLECNIIVRTACGHLGCMRAWSIHSALWFSGRILFINHKMSAMQQAPIIKPPSVFSSQTLRGFYWGIQDRLTMWYSILYTTCTTKCSRHISYVTFSSCEASACRLCVCVWLCVWRCAYYQLYNATVGWNSSCLLRDHNKLWYHNYVMMSVHHTKVLFLADLSIL